jgi:hypothetical protein
MAGTRVSAWRAVGSPAVVWLEGLSILRPVARVVAAHLPLHLLQQIGGRPSDLRPTGTTRITYGGPFCPGVGLSGLQGQRAAWTIGIEGVGDHSLEEHGHGGWGAFSPDRGRPHGNRETWPPERADDDRVGMGHPLLGAPPCSKALPQRPKQAADRAGEAACTAQSLRQSKSIERQRTGSPSPRVPLVRRPDTS